MSVFVRTPNQETNASELVLKLSGGTQSTMAKHWIFIAMQEENDILNIKRPVMIQETEESLSDQSLGLSCCIAYYDFLSHTQRNTQE